MTIQETKGIWVYAEVTDHTINPATYELLAKAQELKAINQEPVIAVLLKTSQDNYEKDLIAYGADCVVVVSSELFEDYDPRLYKDALVTLANRYRPSTFLLAATFQGRSLAPRTQGALQTGLTADCLDLTINDQGKLVQIKPSYGDNLMCTILIPSQYPQMTTVRPNVFKPLEYDANRKGEVIQEAIDLSKDYTYEVISRIAIEVKPNSLTDANHVVAFGRGIKSQEDVIYLEKLAEKLNAKIGVTRPLAENGWYTINEQIGQSGVTITPELILNFGIAGAVQYTVGMKDAKFVFSVNKDEHAAIFKNSDYGYIGDAKEFAIELTKQLAA